MRKIKAQTDLNGCKVLTCNCCGKEKSLSKFPANRNKCKECTAEYQKEHYVTRARKCTPEQIIQRNIKQSEQQWVNRRVKKYARKRKRIISIALYDGRLYAKFNSPRAKIQYRIQIECDSLWDKFCSLESLISKDAFKIIGRINQIEYLTV